MFQSNFLVFGHFQANKPSSWQPDELRHHWPPNAPWSFSSSHKKGRSTQRRRAPRYRCWRQCDQFHPSGKRKLQGRLCKQWTSRSLLLSESFRKRFVHTCISHHAWRVSVLESEVQLLARRATAQDEGKDVPRGNHMTCNFIAVLIHIAVQMCEFAFLQFNLTVNSLIRDFKFKIVIYFFNSEFNGKTNLFSQALVMTLNTKTFNSIHQLSPDKCQVR